MSLPDSSFEKKMAPLPLIIGGGLLAAGIAAFFIFHHSDDDGAPAKREEIHMISLPPPPPPPPPPKIEPPKPEEQKFQKEEAPTEKPPEKAPEPAPAPLSTSIKGDDASGLAAGNGGGGGTGFGGKGGGGSKYGYYAGQVQSRVVEVLRSHKKTRSAVMNVQVRIWADSMGKISKVCLGQSTGDPALDNAIKNEVFSDITLNEPPPQGMPMPIVMHFKATRPN